jgi:hypothetical protein
MDNIKAWAFPIDCDENGNIKTVTGEDAIRQSIIMIMNTRIGERYFHRGYGVGLNQFVFSVVNYTVITQIEDSLRQAIETWEKRVKLIKVEAKGQRNKILIDVVYEFNHREHHYTHSLEVS